VCLFVAQSHASCGSSFRFAANSFPFESLARTLILTGVGQGR
jgi:hypothetical protein